MKKLQKIGVLSVITGLLVVGGLYLRGDGRSDFSAEMQEMTQLQSRMIANNLTDADLDKLKAAYDAAKVRMAKFTTWRIADQDKIETIFSNYRITPLTDNNENNDTIFEAFIKTLWSPRATYLEGTMNIKGIGNWLPTWSTVTASSDSLAWTIKNSSRATKQADYEELQKLAKSVNDLSHDISAMDTFIKTYDGQKARFCTTNDLTNDTGVLGTVRMYVGGARIPDVCDGNSVKQVACVNNRVTLTNGRPVATTTACPNGCGEGVCLGGSLGALSTTTSAGAALSDIKTGQAFYIKAASVSLVAGQSLTAEITLPSGCTQTGSNSIAVATTSTPVQYGPITCTTRGNKVFNVALKNGSTVVNTYPLTVSIAQNAAERIEVTISPASPQANTPFTATVTVYGGNGAVLTNYTEGFYISLIGTGDTTFPEAEQQFNNGVATVNGLIFSTASSGTTPQSIKVISGDRALEKEITVTVGA